MLRLLALVLVLAAAALPAAHASAASRGKHCGLTARIHGQRFDIFESEGHAACRTVKPIISRYLRTFRVSRPWFCAESHGNQFPWAASCANRHVVLHAYDTGRSARGFPGV